VVQTDARAHHHGAVAVSYSYVSTNNTPTRALRTTTQRRQLAMTLHRWRNAVLCSHPVIP
jgi:hypothetical protein